MHQGYGVYARNALANAGQSLARARDGRSLLLDTPPAEGA
jgi:hypothetical protein